MTPVAAIGAPEDEAEFAELTESGGLAAAIAANTQQFAKELTPARSDGEKPALVVCGMLRRQRQRSRVSPSNLAFSALGRVPEYPGQPYVHPHAPEPASNNPPTPRWTPTRNRLAFVVVRGRILSVPQ